MTEQPPKDHDGLALVVGCRVFVPPRVPGQPYALAETVGVEVGTPPVSGRIQRIYTGKRGLVADVRGFENTDYGVRTVPLNLCRVMQGDTKAERLVKHAAAKEAGQ